MATTKKAKAKKGTNKTRKDGKKKIWEKRNPKASSKKMTSGEKRSAKERAKEEGRSKPSLVDNINAQKGTGGTSKAGKKKAGSKKAGSKK